MSRARRYVFCLPYALIFVVIGFSLFGDAPVWRLPNSGGCLLLGGRSQSVGGVSIAPDGALKNADVEAVREMQTARADVLKRVPADLECRCELRKISLRRLEAAIVERQQAGHTLDDSMRLLAGLQGIRYVLAVPEDHDIILAGPAEGWLVEPHGMIVGRTSGMPTLLFDDLLVALRSARQMQQLMIACSIDPTADGLKRLRQYVARLSTIGNPQETAQAIEQVLGSQVITIGGVPTTSHFARILVAADYRMKRLGMGFDVAPVAGLPSYLQLMKVGGRGMQNMTPRWWMVPDYGAIHRDAAGITWELPSVGVETLTEQTFFADDGAKDSHTGKTSSTAQAWADHMTAKYEELAKKEPVFAQLRNCMQLALVAALVVHQGLADKAGHDFQVLFAGKQLSAEEFPVPRKIDTQVSFVRRGGSWILSASGGVQIEPDAPLKKAESVESLTKTAREIRSAVPADLTWWWD